MDINKAKTIDVINYHSFGIAVKTKDDSYWIEPMRDGVPTRVPLLPEEIKYTNTISEAFKGGYLFFDEDLEEAVYEDILRLPNWRDILKPDQIKDILCNPTIEGLQRILNIRNASVFDIVRGIFVSTKNGNDDSITTRVERIINERHKELQNKIYNTNIVLKPKDTTPAVSTEDMDDLKRQNESMQKELESMREMMASILENSKNDQSQKVAAQKADKSDDENGDGNAKRGARRSTK